jgi:CheY-like chemotaxis protein
MASSRPVETIVVVDDEPEVLSMTADSLRVKGYNVVSTGDPREALRLARTGPTPVDLLLTDVVMPLMSGRQLADEFPGHPSHCEDPLHVGVQHRDGRGLSNSAGPRGAVSGQAVHDG